MTSTRAECPRCAYDLSGLVESWQHSCPLHGRCSECGLDFEWRDVLSAERRLPRWSFEHAPRGRRVRTFFGTLVRSLVPPRLWRGIRMEMSIAPRRLVLFALFGMLTLKVLGACILGGAVVTAWYLHPFGSVTLDEVLLRVAWPYNSFASWWSDDDLLTPWVAISGLTVAIVPFAFFLVPTSLRRAKVSRRHIFRVQAYTLAALPFLLGSWSLMRTIYIVTEAFWWELLWELGWGDDGTLALGVGLMHLACTLALLLWSWGAATRHYMRLPRSGAVTAAMVAIAFLVSAVAVVMTYGHALFF